MRSPSLMSSGTVEMLSLGNAPRTMASKHLYLKVGLKTSSIQGSRRRGFLNIFLPITQTIHAAVKPGLSRKCKRAFQGVVLAHDTSVP